MVPAFNPMSCPNLAVPAEVMQHVADVESGSNPFAIGVVNGRLERQPRNLSEAVATVRMLEADGYNYSLGLAQINRKNLARYGLDTYKKAFDGCANLAAGARILAECYGRSNLNWGDAFSCYYSGNFVTGYQDGYVARIYDSLEAGSAGTQPIVVYAEPPKHRKAAGTAVPGFATQSAGYRVALRSSALDALGTSLALSVARPLVRRIADGTVAPQATAAPATDGPAGGDAPFVPRVSSRGDRDAETVVRGTARNAHSSPKAVDVAQSDSQAEPSDAAFVF